jgi:flagellar basal body P-ring protein FlgI
VLSLPDIPTVDELVTLLQATGLESDTIIEILKAIERAGALYGRLVIM